MSTAPKRLLTEAEYLAAERAAETKSEYFAGEMFALAGARRNHNVIVTNVVGELRQQLRHRPCEAYPSDMRVKVGRTGLYTYPDVVVVCGQPEFLDATEVTLLNPTLLVEVLSSSTANYVRGLKSRCFRALPSLQEYVLAESEELQVEVFRRAEGGQWLVEDVADLTAQVALHSIGCALGLAAIYENVDVPPRGPT